MQMQEAWCQEALLHPKGTEADKQFWALPNFVRYHSLLQTRPECSDHAEVDEQPSSARRGQVGFLDHHSASEFNSDIRN